MGNGVRVSVIERVGVAATTDSVEASAVAFANESNVCKVAVVEGTLVFSGGSGLLKNTTQIPIGITIHIPNRVIAVAPSNISYKRFVER